MTTTFPSPKHPHWKILYRAAILETNKSVLPQRVSEAEEAVILRGQELFYGNPDPDEVEALDDALYALSALKTACQYNEADVA